MRISSLAVRTLAVLLLVGTVAAAPHASRQVRLQGTALETCLGPPDGWVLAQAGETEVAEGGTVVKQQRVYRDEAGREVTARVIATATRLGALRDYSVALEAQGWVRSDAQVIAGPRLAHIEQPMSYRIERLRRADKEILTVVWFVSSRRQAHSLAGAELGGWSDLVVSVCPPLWLELYGTLEVDGDAAEAHEAIAAFASAMGPGLAHLVSGGTDRPAARTQEAR